MQWDQRRNHQTYVLSRKDRLQQETLLFHDRQLAIRLKIQTRFLNIYKTFLCLFLKYHFIGLFFSNCLYFCCSCMCNLMFPDFIVLQDGNIEKFFRISSFSGENQIYCEKCDKKSDATSVSYK